MRNCNNCGEKLNNKELTNLQKTCDDCLGVLSSVQKTCDDYSGVMSKKQVGGDHYASQKIQPIDYIQANDLGFEEGNIVKYITRHKLKNGKEDVEKALHYCELLLRRYDANSN